MPDIESHLTIRKPMDQRDQPTKPEHKPEQQLDRSPEGIAYRKLVNDLERQLVQRYIKECSKAHKIELHNLIKSGMTNQEAKDAHSDYPDWVFGQLIRAFLEMED